MQHKILFADIAETKTKLKAYMLVSATITVVVAKILAYLKNLSLNQAAIKIFYSPLTKLIGATAAKIGLCATGSIFALAAILILYQIYANASTIKQLRFKPSDKEKIVIY